MAKKKIPTNRGLPPSKIRKSRCKHPGKGEVVNPEVLAPVPRDTIELPPDEAELILEDIEFFL